jgi:spore coat polysaccharide biosynthesis protein SpsF
VQSRLSSARLPGKALLTIGGLPMVVLVARRAATTGLRVVVATSDEPSDDPIVETLAAHGIDCARGSLHDPLRRFETTTEGLDEGDVVVRLTADNVVPDGELVQGLVDGMDAKGGEYSRMADQLPHGLSAECFSVRLLRAAAAGAVDAYDREHVTPWMRRNVDEVHYRPDDVPAAWESLRCTVDTLQDYRAAFGVMASIPAPASVGWRSLLERWASAGPARAALPPRRPNSIDQGPLLLGTAQLGMPYGVTNSGGLPEEDLASEMLAVAAAAGVTHVDTARAYGLSESRIGEARESGLAAGLGVVTKVGPLDDLPADATPALGRAAVDASVGRSLSALRSTSVDVVLVHRWHDWAKAEGAVGHFMAELREEGIARLVGASVGGTHELLEALADPAVGYVQLPFNLLDRQWLATPVLSALASRPDVVVTARSVFLQGLLTAGRGVRWPSLGERSAAELETALEGLVRDLERRSLADLCVAYVLGHAFVTSVVIGAETPSQVRENAELVRLPPLAAAEIELVHLRLPPGPPDLVDPSRWSIAHE